MAAIGPHIAPKGLEMDPVGRPWDPRTPWGLWGGFALPTGSMWQFLFFSVAQRPLHVAGALGPGPWALGPWAWALGPWARALAPVPWPGPWALVPWAWALPWALSLGPGPWARSLGPGPGLWSLAPGPGPLPRALGPGPLPRVHGAPMGAPRAPHGAPWGLWGPWGPMGRRVSRSRGFSRCRGNGVRSCG